VTRKKLFIKSYGCQMNVYDSNRMTDLLRPLGYETTDLMEGADIVILNTCHIREKAEDKVYSDLGRVRPFKMDKEDMIVAVAGCSAQALGDEILRQAPYVDMVFGPQTYHRLPEMIAKLARSKASDPRAKVLDVDFPEESKFDHLPDPTPTNAQGLSAFVSVQEGCDKFCTFCVVPYTRGAEYSRPIEQIILEIKALLNKGIKEITLLGQNVNAFHGLDGSSKEWNLGKLIMHIAEFENLERIRYTTSHPNDMHEDLYEAHRVVEKLMPHLHLPVQVGSDSILKAMNRKHSCDEYLRIIDRMKTMRPEMAFSSDFIVGFPGESEKDFQDTLKLVETVGYAQAYSFKYSIRPGTPAGAMEYQVPEEVKNDRLYRLQDILNQQQLAFNKSFVGKNLDVLFERDGKYDGQLIGKTPYLQSVYIQGNPRLKGQILSTKITDAKQNGLAGELNLVQDEMDHQLKEAII
jgi:tRNA-2-methylthio-N6-dimethylallyladenosine synthase